jgi:glycerol uptake facilitator protein
MSPYLAEFLGTMLLVLLGDGVVAGAVLKNSKSENTGWQTIVIAWGLSVMIAIYAVGRISGAHLNPAVSLALYISGDFDGSLLPGYIIAQFAGAFTGAIVMWLHYLPHWEKTEDPSRKLSAFCTSPAIRSVPHNLTSEIIGTLVLTLGILLIGANEFSEGLKPVVVGALIATIGFCLGGTTGFAINPARDFGPRAAHFLLPIPGKGSSDWTYSWIPVAGPLIGGALGAWIYKAIFVSAP